MNSIDLDKLSVGGNNGFGVDGNNGFMYLLFFLLLGRDGINGNNLSDQQIAQANTQLASIKAEVEAGNRSTIEVLASVQNTRNDLNALGRETQVGIASIIASANDNKADFLAAICQTQNVIERGSAATISAINECCCKTQLSLSETRNDINNGNLMLGNKIDTGNLALANKIDNQTCAITHNADKNTDRVIAYMNNEKIESLRDENQSLKFQASQTHQTSTILHHLA